VGVRRIGKRPFAMLHPSLIKRKEEFPRTKKMDEAHHGKQNSKQPPVTPLFLRVVGLGLFLITVRRHGGFGLLGTSGGLLFFLGVDLGLNFGLILDILAVEAAQELLDFVVFDLDLLQGLFNILQRNIIGKLAGAVLIKVIAKVLNLLTAITDVIEAKSS
jgi:hypothetical protein